MNADKSLAEQIEMDEHGGAEKKSKESASDLGRLVQLCDCGPARNKTGAAKTKPPPRQPSRARCAAQLGVEGPPGASFERATAARCCEGWDCPKPMCQGEEPALDRTL